MNERHSDFKLPVGLLYPLAAVFVVIPLADIGIGLYPPRIHEMQWRVGSMGLVTGAMLLPLLGFVLALLAAHLLSHRVTQRVLEAFYGLLGLTFLVLTVLFVLDAIQIRKDVAPQLQTAYDLAALKGAFTQLLLGVMMLTLGIVSFRRGRAAQRRTERARRTEDQAVPIVGAMKN